MKRSEQEQLRDRFLNENNPIITAAFDLWELEQLLAKEIDIDGFDDPALALYKAWYTIPAIEAIEQAMQRIIEQNAFRLGGPDGQDVITNIMPYDPRRYDVEREVTAPKPNEWVILKQSAIDILQPRGRPFRLLNAMVEPLLEKR